MNSFPIYLLKLGDETRVVFPDDRSDLGHTDFWEETISHLVAAFFHLPQAKLRDLPYCQRRARIVEAKVYYGETPDPILLKFIRQALANDNLDFYHDDHEKRLREDVRQFRKLLRRYNSGE